MAECASGLAVLLSHTERASMRAAGAALGTATLPDEAVMCACQAAPMLLAQGCWRVIGLKFVFNGESQSKNSTRHSPHGEGDLYPISQVIAAH